MLVDHNPQSPDALQANRAGQLSVGQREALAPQARLRWASLSTPFVVLPIAFAFVIALVLWASRRQGGVSLDTWLGMLACMGPIWLLALGLAARRLWQAARVRGDLEAGRVESAEGECRWRRNHYSIETSAGRLTRPYFVGGLLPGHYRFYFLPNSRLMLGAEKLPGLGGEEPGGDLLAVLAQTNHFDVGALAANREGRLAASQQLQLLWKLARQAFLALVMILLLGFVAVNVYLANRALPDTVLAAIAGIGILVVAVIGLRSMGRVGLDMLNARVLATQGSVRRDRRVVSTGRGTSVQYSYAVDNLSFTASRAAYEAFIDGGSYRIYYTPQSKTLVAIEPV